MTKKQAITGLLLLAASFLPFAVQGQRIVRLNIPGDVCAGTSPVVTFGYDKGNGVVVSSGESTLGHNETVFLPDGVECDGSCSYVSPVTFSDFDDTACVRSAEDIHFVRIKMEHSYIGDIYIGFRCPNGQRADLMRYAGSGTSSCDHTIPASARHWSSGLNVAEDTFLGEAKKSTNEADPCNPNAFGNEPGKGWTYCWRDNTQMGYKYADGDGLIYRRSHSHDKKIDSSHVDAGKNFYHPDDSFDKLVGCPLNGTWSIVVVDGFKMDNGYIFSWEMTLDPSLLPRQCKLEKAMVEGGAAERVNDTTLRLVSPSNITTDTTVHYTLLVLTSCGDTLDTTASVTYHPGKTTSIDTTVCEGTALRFGQQTIATAGHHEVMTRTTAGCDSLLKIDLTTMPTYDQHVHDTICKGNRIEFEGEVYTTHGDYIHRLRTGFGCDSLRTLHLVVQGEDLLARIQAAPMIVDAERRRVALRDASRNHVRRMWDLGGLASSDREELAFDYPEEYDSLVVVLRVENHQGCSDTDTAMLRYDRSLATVPNAFTPNLSENNRWRPVVHDATDLEVWVYNRAGVLAAHLESLDDEWDGTLPDGAPAPQGTYVYTLRFHSRVRPQRPVTLTGSVTQIR